jgi:hypothetical protein
MPTPSSLQAAIIAAVTQIVALVVGFGLLKSTEQGVVVNAATSIVVVAFLIANSVHANADAKVEAAGIAPPRPVK